MLSTSVRRPPAFGRPAAIGFVRAEVSVHHAYRHDCEIRWHAGQAGYRYLSTVYPSTGGADPLAYIRARATELGAGVIIAFDLGHVDNRPHLFCDLGYRLETVCPHQVWTPSVPPVVADVASI